MKRIRAKRKRLKFLLLYTVFVFLLFEGSFRTYLALRGNASFFRPADVILDSYPELALCRNIGDDASDNTLDILILSGSALNANFVDIGGLLIQRIKKVCQTQPRIYNLSMLAHSTRDSFLKRSLLSNASFDIVVVYHGINDARANNCPDKMFDTSYSHYQFYERVNALYRHRRLLNWTTLPLALSETVISLKQLTRKDRYMPLHRPRPEWVCYGGNIKTVHPFRTHIMGISQICKRKKEALVLLTYAHYVPSDYSLEAFRKKELDYVEHLYPVELYGESSNVEAAILAHNHVTAEIAHSDPDIHLLDMAQIIPNEGSYFDDICHLSDAGYEVFADALAQVILDITHAKTGVPNQTSGGDVQ